MRFIIKQSNHRNEIYQYGNLLFEGDEFATRKHGLFFELKDSKETPALTLQATGKIGLPGSGM